MPDDGTLIIPGGPSFSGTPTPPGVPPDAGIVNTFNTRTGNVVLTNGDITSAGGALSPSTATGGTAPRALVDRFAESVNVKDFGAKGDGTTDDTAAINAALNFIRALPAVDGHRPFNLVFPYGRYLVTAPLNFTGLATMASGVIDGQGSVIIARMSGGVVIDCLGSRWLRFHDLSLFGDPTTTPRIGIQVGRISNASADYHHFCNVHVMGSWTLTAYLNFAAETTAHYACSWRNNLTTADKYCMILDGQNHWNVTSTFVTQTLPADTNASFNENLFSSCTWQGNGTNGVIWIGYTGRHKLDTCYASCPRGWIFTLYRGVGAAPGAANLDINCHCETTGLQYCIMFTGAAGVTLAWINGFRFTDHSAYGAVAIFGIDPASSITSVDLRNADIDAPNFVGGATLFDQPAKYSVRSGRANLNVAAQWVVPGYWDGRVSFHNNPGQNFATLDKWTTGTRPTPPAGTIGYAADTSRIEYYDGSVWGGFTKLSGDTMTGGINFTGTAAAAGDLSKHIQLTAGNGINMYAGRLNITSANSTYFVNGSADIGSVWSDGLHLVKGFGVWNSAVPSVKPVVSGAKGSNAALASLLTALAAYGLITDSSTA